ncbi:hypothetical protein HDU96_006129 [Phlyctochytrium bullatum]|nr:hypothetical protein HDU96_006129 [Phlyctochytrium bullatum]
MQNNGMDHYAFVVAQNMTAAMNSAAGAGTGMHMQGAGAAGAQNLHFAYGQYLRQQQINAALAAQAAALSSWIAQQPEMLQIQQKRAFLEETLRLPTLSAMARKVCEFQHHQASMLHYRLEVEAKTRLGFPATPEEQFAAREKLKEMLQTLVALKDGIDEMVQSGGELQAAAFFDATTFVEDRYLLWMKMRVVQQQWSRPSPMHQQQQWGRPPATPQHHQFAQTQRTPQPACVNMASTAPQGTPRIPPGPHIRPPPTPSTTTNTPHPPQITQTLQKRKFLEQLLQIPTLPPTTRKLCVHQFHHTSITLLQYDIERRKGVVSAEEEDAARQRLQRMVEKVRGLRSEMEEMVKEGVEKEEEVRRAVKEIRERFEWWVSQTETAATAALA